MAVLNAQKAPVLPIPALKERRRERERESNNIHSEYIMVIIVELHSRYVLTLVIMEIIIVIYQLISRQKPLLTYYLDMTADYNVIVATLDYLQCTTMGLSPVCCCVLMT
jgi:hypothetical protein